VRAEVYQISRTEAGSSQLKHAFGSLLEYEYSIHGEVHQESGPNADTLGQYWRQVEVNDFQIGYTHIDRQPDKRRTQE
jgi:hypothetical protein